MIRFFVENILGNSHTLSGDDAYHAVKGLRLRVGEKLILCDKNSVDHVCVVEEIHGQTVQVQVIDSHKCCAEPNIKITLYQAFPKSDKMDLIVQKAVELGVFKIVPVLTARCVSRPDEKSLIKKRERWQKISKEAAMQSGRGIIPEILEPVTFNKVCSLLNDYDKTLVFYENGGEKIQNALNSNIKDLAIFVGPEGGFEEDEIDSISNYGATIATLGTRILRTETAPLAAISIIVNMFE